MHPQLGFSQGTREGALRLRAPLSPRPIGPLLPGRINSHRSVLDRVLSGQAKILRYKKIISALVTGKVLSEGASWASCLRHTSVWIEKGKNNS